MGLTGEVRVETHHDRYEFERVVGVKLSEFITREIQKAGARAALAEARNRSFDAKMERRERAARMRKKK